MVCSSRREVGKNARHVRRILYERNILSGTILFGQTPFCSVADVGPTLNHVAPGAAVSTWRRASQFGGPVCVLYLVTRPMLQNIQTNTLLSLTWQTSHSPFDHRLTQEDANTSFVLSARPARKVRLRLEQGPLRYLSNIYSICTITRHPALLHSLPHPVKFRLTQVRERPVLPCKTRTISILMPRTFQFKPRAPPGASLNAIKGVPRHNT